MIPKQFRLEFVTPERAVALDDIDEAEIPGEAGYFGVLPGHAPLLAALKPGEMWFRKGADRVYAFVGGGFAEVLPDKVTILAEVAERAEDIDVARAEASKRRAEERLGKTTASSSTVEMDVERARIALMKAISRLQVSRHARPRG
jgi:F-type H+-transporting ATPase subunit epsilon